MKKLIALLFCLTVAAVAAYAEYPKQAPEKNAAMQQALDKQVNIAQRTTVLQISAVGYDSNARGKAVLMGFTDNYKKIVFMSTRDLNNEVVALGDDDLYGAVVTGPFKVKGAVDYKHVNLNGVNLIKIVMPAKVSEQKAKQFPMLTDAQAVSMAKTLQGKDDKALEQYRNKVVDTGKHK